MHVTLPTVAIVPPIHPAGRLVKDGKIKSIEEVFLFSMPIKEYQIVDTLLGEACKDEVMQIMPVQKQSSAGQRTRFRCCVVVGDSNGHLGLGVKCSKEVATAIRGGIIAAKMNVVPVRRGFWGKMSGKPHTVPCKLTARCGSVRVRLVPAPRGTGLVAAGVPKKILTMAGIDDVYTSCGGKTRTVGNFVHACFTALKASYAFLTPDLWTDTVFSAAPAQQHTDFLQNYKAAKKPTYAEAY
jgi:small subunit ribosomal protein S2e